MPRRPSSLSLACCFSTTLALVVLAAPARAQDRKGILPDEGETAFQKEWTKSEGPRAIFNRINKSTSGEGERASKESKEHQNAIDMAAKYHTYRLTWDKNTDPGEVDKYMNEFLREVNGADSDAMRANNPVFGEMYLKALALGARDVVQTRQPIAAVNAGRMLARLAKAGSEEAGKACLEAVKNANDFVEPHARMGVQYWAVQGLGDLLGRWTDAPPAEGAPPVPPGRKERLANYAEALVGVIEQFLPRDGKLPAELVPSSEEEKLGLQLFRREAVRALAKYREPAATDAKGVIKVKSALTLLRVMNGNGVTPPVRLDEQMEAAWGVARLRSKALASYQPDYAAQQIGNVVVEMARQTQTDVRPKNFPWRVHAARLADAVEAMRADVKGSPDKAATAYVDKMVAQALRILKEGIELTQKANGGDLNNWLTTTAPPHNTLYKDAPDAVVGAFQKGETAPVKPAAGGSKPGEKKPGDTKPGEKKPDGKKPSKP